MYLSWDTELSVVKPVTKYDPPLYASNTYRLFFREIPVYVYRGYYTFPVEGQV